MTTSALVKASSSGVQASLSALNDRFSSWVEERLRLRCGAAVCEILKGTKREIQGRSMTSDLCMLRSTGI